MQDTDREIAALASSLAHLLLNPEPGLFSWQQARVRVARRLLELLREVLAPYEGMPL